MADNKQPGNVLSPLRISGPSLIYARQTNEEKKRERERERERGRNEKKMSIVFVKVKYFNRTYERKKKYETEYNTNSSFQQK